MVFFNINTCRICLREEISLFLIDADPIVIKKIEEITSIQLQKGENFPTKICQPCLKNINTFHNFRKVIISNECELIERSEYIEKAKNKQVILIVEPHSTIDNYFVVQQIESPKKPVKKIRTKRKVVHKCDQCSETFTSLRRLGNHKVLVHSHLGKAKCDVCGVLVRAENFKQHKRKHFHYRPVKCEICGSLLKHKHSLRAHMRLLHTDKVYTCHICGKSTIYLTHLKVHLKRLHGKDIDDCKVNYSKYVCNICGKGVADINRHMNIHTKKSTYQCEYCAKVLATRYSLKVHTTRAHRIKDSQLKL